jgi:hypothetical protein
MTRLHNYILSEGRSVLISQEQAVTFIQSKAPYIIPKLKDIVNYGADWIYRGINSLEGKPAYTIDPKQHDRTSANTVNYYTWIIDNSPDWAKYPKRSQSIICSSSESGAFSSAKNHYIVIPEVGSNIGICLGGDIWDSFDAKLQIYDIGPGGLTDFNDMLSDILGNKSSNTYYDLIKACTALDNKKAEYGDVLSFTRSIFPNGQNEDFLSDYYYGPDSFYEFLQELLNPTDNGFNRAKVQQYKPKERHEVWTDGESLLVNFLKAKEILGELL